jgi:two-component system LytT family sensor kinase
MIPNDQNQRPFGLRLLLLLFAICSLMGLYNFSTFLAQHRMESEAEPVRKILLNEMTGAYSLFVLLPFVLVFMDRFPVRRANWGWSVPMHLFASVIFGATSTTLMTISRKWLYPVFDLRSYNPGQIVYRYLLEYHKQLLLYTLIWATVFVIARMRAARERERETAELALRASKLQIQLSEARLRSLQGQLQPHFLFNTLNMISSFMYQDVRKADRMMARLSTLLRMSLDTSERPCVPLH